MSPMRPLKSLFWLKKSSMAVTKAATLPFMSAAPRPIKKPFSSKGKKGSCFQSSMGPVGTTSVCPRKIKRGPSFP